MPIFQFFFCFAAFPHHFLSSLFSPLRDNSFLFDFNLCYKTYNLFGTFFKIICLYYTFFIKGKQILIINYKLKNLFWYGKTCKNEIIYFVFVIALFL